VHWSHVPTAILGSSTNECVHRTFIRCNRASLGAFFCRFWADLNRLCRDAKEYLLGEQKSRDDAMLILKMRNSLESNANLSRTVYKKLPEMHWMLLSVFSIIVIHMYNYGQFSVISFPSNRCLTSVFHDPLNTILFVLLTSLLRIAVTFLFLTSLTFAACFSYLSCKMKKEYLYIMK